MTAAAAFIVRDFRIAWSYRFGFFFQYTSVLLALVSNRFLADVVGSSVAIEPYGGDYFAFALIGTSLPALMLPALTTFRGAVREAQVMGTFEAMLMTRPQPRTIIASAATYPLIQSLAQPVLLAPTMGIALGAGFRLENAPLVLAVVALALMASAGFGLLSAAFTIAFRQNEPFTLTMFSLSTLLAGTIYPVSVLPDWLEPVTLFLPLTHALELARGVFIEGANVENMGAHFAALAAFSALLPLGLWAVGRAIERAKRTGTLAQY